MHHFHEQLPRSSEKCIDRLLSVDLGDSCYCQRCHKRVDPKKYESENVDGFSTIRYAPEGGDCATKIEPDCQLEMGSQREGISVEQKTTGQELYQAELGKSEYYHLSSSGP